MDASPFAVLALPHIPVTIHNVRLISGSSRPGDGFSVLQVEHEGTIHNVTGAYEWSAFSENNLAGKIGFLERRYSSELTAGALWFTPYIDQSLRRCPHFDTLDKHGWTCDRWAHVVAAPHVVPGVDGEVVRDETKPITVPIPREFELLARSFGLSPLDLLRAFIADAAEIHNMVAKPREDGYASNGSDERDMAIAYIERAFGGRRVDMDELERRDEEAEERQGYVDDLEAALDDYIDRGGDPRQFLAAVDKIVDGDLVADNGSQEMTHGD